jgi:hypothetical protein
MATYHLYYLSGGQLIGSDDIEAGDDREATRIAQARGRGDLVEIWNAAERVRICRPDAARLEAVPDAAAG